jgi:hypothetical protein
MASRRIQAIKHFPDDLAPSQLQDVQCASLRLCNAIIVYLALVIENMQIGTLSNSFSVDVISTC